MSKYVIENYRPTQSDVELLVVSAKAADMQVGQLLRRRIGPEWQVEDMPVFRTGDGLEHKDRDWVGRCGDSYAARVVLTPAGLELLTDALIQEAAGSTYSLQFQVGRRELDDLYHAEFRLGRALNALRALGSPRWRELDLSIEPAMERARREAEEQMDEETRSKEEKA